MNKTELEDFVDSIENFQCLEDKVKVDLFAYFLTNSGGAGFVTGATLGGCFETLSMKKYSRISAYISEESKKKKDPRYIKCKQGYRLERNYFMEIGYRYFVGHKKIAVSQQLKDLVIMITEKQERTFLEEALACYEIEANRAAIILVWIVTMEHMQNIVFTSKLTEFNTELSKSPSKKIKKIISKDDFEDLSEDKFIELMRSSRIITNNERKILDEKLGIRNSASHPNGIVFTTHKTTEFMIDLIENILLKH